MSNIDIFTPRGAELYTEQMRILISRYGGVCYPLDDDLSTVSKTGVVRELSGAYPGAVSGATYYNSVTVSGTLNPDATGTYTAAGVYNGVPYWRRADGGYHVWRASNFWAISQSVPQSVGARWLNSSATPYETYFPNNSTGNATMAAVTASGIYRFDPAGVTFGQPGPVLGGALQGAAGFVTPGLIDTNYSALTPPFTICSFARVTGVATTLWHFGNTANPQPVFNPAQSAGRSLIYLSGSLFKYFKSSGEADGNWHFFTLVIASWSTLSGIKYYFDGIEVPDDLVNQSGTSQPRTTVKIGSRTPVTASATTAIIPAALTSNEINYLYLLATKSM